MVPKPWKIVAIVAGVIIGLLVLLWRQTDEHAVVGARGKDAGVGVSASASVSDDRRSPTLTLAPTPAETAAGSRVHAEPTEAIDPCDPLPRVDIPAGFDSTVIDGITIAWQHDAAPGPLDVALSPTMLARVVQGALADAADATGTVPRAQLVVFVHSSLRDLRAGDSVPAWAGGTYDGAVHVARDGRSELGVRVSTLRHEVMHAQLHAAVGCMPAWFNEGIASYFSSELPLRDLFAMLRDHALLDMPVMEARTFASLGDADSARAYWQGVAMVAYAIERGDGGSLPSLVHRIGTLGSADEVRLTAWRHWFPGIGGQAVLDAFARHLFGGPPRLDGTICCSGLRDFEVLSCHVATTHEIPNASYCLPPM